MGWRETLSKSAFSGNQWRVNLSVSCLWHRSQSWRGFDLGGWVASRAPGRTSFLWAPKGVCPHSLNRRQGWHSLSFLSSCAASFMCLALLKGYFKPNRQSVWEFSICQEEQTIRLVSRGSLVEARPSCVIFPSPHLPIQETGAIATMLVLLWVRQSCRISWITLANSRSSINGTLCLCY